MDHRSIKTLFEHQASHCSARTAAYCGTRQITFGELNRQANQVARALRRRKVVPGTLIGIYMHRSLEMLIGLLGVIKAGAAYLPLDLGYPQKRLSYLIEDSKLGMILCAAPPDGWREALGINHSLTALDLCAPQSGIEAEDGADVFLKAMAERLTYVIYTSGSTGQPKGVLGTEAGMLNRLRWMWERYPFRSDEVGCVKTSLSFLDSFWEIFGHLLQGIPVVLAPDEVVKNPAALVQSLEASRVTRLVVVPSLLQALLSNVPDIGDRLRRLTLWVTSGEALEPELADRFQQMLPHARLLNLYGASEVSADCAWYDTTENSLSIVALGRPIVNNELYILDEELQPVPPGVAGELYVGGVGLAWGYLRRADLTAERFIANPFGPSGSRLFRTGDLARQLTDGMIEYLGRADQQVKIRGFRVELGEIEATLRSHPQVSQAVAIVRKDGARRKEIVAYVTPVGGHHLDGREIRAFLAERLPAYMTPTAVVPLLSLPLTPSGKVDRNALPAPDFSAQYQPPQNHTETLLTGLFAELLEIPRVGIDDKFFDLGGDSLTLMDLVSQAHAAGLTISHLDVLRHQTPRALAAAVSSIAGQVSPERNHRNDVPFENSPDKTDFKL